MNERAQILVVDDTPDNILLLAETLKSDYHVQVANSGARALTILQRSPRPDLILLDVMMPEMDGYEVCRRVKADSDLAGIPVIFITALDGAGDEEQGLVLGAVDYITKPINPSLVQARVRNHLELKWHRDQLEQLVQERTQQLLQETLSRKLLEKDLKLAHQVQASMLPPSKAARHGWQLAGYLQPARAVGGDLFDYLWLDDERLLFAIGDVSDKGTAAALFMVRVLTLLRWLGPTAESPAELLAQLNTTLSADNETCMFVTLAVGILELKSGRVRYSSGGHEPPLLFQPETSPTLLEFETGQALGVGESDYPQHEFKMEPGQTLLLYTDGLTESNNRDKTELGMGGVLSIHSPAVAVDPESLLRRTVEGVEKFVDGEEAFDDLTLLSVGRAHHLG